MNITPVSHVRSHRTGTLRNVTAEEISEVFGFSPNVDDDPYKVENSWAAEVNDFPGCFTDDIFPVAVWDYKGSHHVGEYSCFGDHDVMIALFGRKYVGNYADYY